MGIFNSKNLKKAVNMVASSSPVLYALSQATDIVDKSMDVIDKNLNGGKNWNFSNEPIEAQPTNPVECVQSLTQKHVAKRYMIGEKFLPLRHES